MSDASNKEFQATMEPAEETSQKPTALPVHGSFLEQPLLDPNLDNREEYKLAQKYETKTSKTTKSQEQDTSALTPGAIEKVSEILSNWLETNFCTENKSLLITPTTEGILLQEVTGEKELRDLNAKAFLDGYFHALADTRRELQDELAEKAYFEGYEDALDDVENGLDAEDSEYDFDSAYEFDSGYDSEYDSKYNSEYGSEYAGSEHSDIDSNASSASRTFSDIQHQFQALREDTNLGEIRILKQLESKIKKKIDVVMDNVKQGIETGAILDHLSQSELELLGGVEQIYAGFEAYLLKCKNAREKLGNDLAKVRDGINARQLEADEYPKAFEHESYEQYNEIFERLGRELELDSPRDQDSQACGKGLAACEDCSTTWEGDARTYPGEFQQRSAKRGAEADFQDDGCYAEYTDPCHGFAGTGIGSF